jgi:hypothetical protein
MGTTKTDKIKEMIIKENHTSLDKRERTFNVDFFLMAAKGPPHNFKYWVL